MVKREIISKKQRRTSAAKPAHPFDDVPYGWPGEEQSRDRKKRALWSSMLMSSVIARLF